MTPEAIRARARRERERESGQPGAARFTPDVARRLAPPTPPIQEGPPPDPNKAIRSVRGIIRAVGFITALFLKDDDMEIEEDDAQTTAELIVEGWPELASADSGDMAKITAVGAVIALAGEKIRVHSENVAKKKPVRVVEAPEGKSAGAPMMRAIDSL